MDGNYRDTYIHRDLARLFPRLNKFAYQQFLVTLGKLSGTIINKAELSRALEVGEGTIREYIHIASGTFIFGDICLAIIKMPLKHG